MNKDYALSIAKKIIKKNPKLILCGSLSLILAKKIQDRDIHDLDFCCHKEDFDESYFLRMCNYGPQENNGYKCYCVNSDIAYDRSPLFYNIFVHDKKIKTQKTSLGFLTQDISEILFWKKKFNREKDIKDLKLG